MIALTSQEVFDKALFGIRGQGYKQSVAEDGNTCMYNGPHGLKCGIGHCLPEGYDTAGIESKAIGHAMCNRHIIADLFAGVPLAMLSRIQSLHDYMNKYSRSASSHDNWELSMKSLALEHGLTYTPV